MRVFLKKKLRVFVRGRKKGKKKKKRLEFGVLAGEGKSGFSPGFPVRRSLVEKWNLEELFLFQEGKIIDKDLRFLPMVCPNVKG